MPGRVQNAPDDDFQGLPPRYMEVPMQMKPYGTQYRVLEEGRGGGVDCNVRVYCAVPSIDRVLEEGRGGGGRL